MKKSLIIFTGIAFLSGILTQSVGAQKSVLEYAINDKEVKTIIPYIVLRVVSPNGGEVWDKNKIQIITWDITEDALEKTLEEENSAAYRWQASIDLYRRITICPIGDPNVKCSSDSAKCVIPCGKESVFVKHLATVDLFDYSYSWKIDNDITEGDDYIVKISAGRRIIPCFEGNGLKEKTACLKAKLKELVVPQSYNDSWLFYDESDNPFSVIEGAVPPVPSPTPIPVPPSPLYKAIKTLEGIAEKLEKMAQDIRYVISLLKEISRI